MKYNEISDEIKPNIVASIITMAGKEADYLVLEINKQSIKVLPLEFYLNSEGDNDLVPTLSFPYDLIESVKLTDKTSLLFLTNQRNPHIKNAIDT